MKTISFVSQKGGSGKTTLAVNMAVWAAINQYKIALVDMDPQKSMLGWNKRRDPSLQFDAIYESAGALAKIKASAERAGVDLLITDNAPHTLASTADTVGQSDLVLVPCRPSRFDLDAIRLTLMGFRSSRRPTPSLVVLNACPRGKIVDEAKQEILAIGYDVASEIISHRAAFGHSAIVGLGVHEYEPGGKAMDEVDALFGAIQKTYFKEI